MGYLSTLDTRDILLANFSLFSIPPRPALLTASLECFLAANMIALGFPLLSPCPHSSRVDLQIEFQILHLTHTSTYSTYIEIMPRYVPRNIPEVLLTLSGLNCAQDLIPIYSHDISTDDYRSSLYRDPLGIVWSLAALLNCLYSQHSRVVRRTFFVNTIHPRFMMLDL